MSSQDGRRYRSHEEIIGPCIQYACHGRGFVQWRQNENWDSTEAPYGIAGLPPIEVRHHKIHDDQMRRLLSNPAQAFFAGVDRGNIEAICFQCGRQQTDDGGVVIDDENTGWHVYSGVRAIIAESARTGLCRLITD